MELRSRRSAGLNILASRAYELSNNVEKALKEEKTVNGRPKYIVLWLKHEFIVPEGCVLGPGSKKLVLLERGYLPKD
ncbi:hypothetical protein WJX84_007196 [Apatococcus fuscideae]|uniref:Uncharacterized protein n=1 Tax=Apatococcus fuscideae TaxID=2026836 RepID=A0AAW1TIF6_9CHLO